MSIPDYRTFFRCCAAFLLAGVLAAGHAAAQQEGAPAAVPEQVQEPDPEQPQAEPDHSEMDTVIMALCHEITILKKNEEKRMAIREALVKEADATYNYFDTRVYEMSAVLYALDDQKIFTLAFYCKAATSLVKTYYAQRPDFQGQEERLDKEIGRIKKLAESLEEVNTDNLSEPSLVQRDEALYTCRTLEESLLKEKEQISYLKELFNSLGGKIDALNHESGKLFTSLFNRVFYTPSNAARYIFLKPLKTYEICMGAWETSADSKLQLPSDPETLKHYGLILLGSGLCWAGFSFMAFLVLMTWIMLMTSILLLVGLWNLLHHYENRRKERNKQAILWFRPFVSKLVLPCLTIFLILFSIIWPAATFDMGDLIINKIFATTEIKDLLTFSWSHVITVILIAIVLNYLIFIGKNTLHEVYGEDYEVGIIPTFVTLSSLFLWGLFVFTALIIMNANYNGLLMVMGGLSMGIGFALKDTIENIISGLSLMLGRLRQGDMIECDGYRGRVSSLGYRSTMIETLDGSIIAFQNSQLFNKNFRNMTRNHKFECSKVEVGISYGTDVERARQIVLETLSSLPFLSKVKKTSVVLDSFGDSSVNLGVWVWVPVMTKASSLSSVREHIYNAFNEHGISIPFPQQDLYVKEFPGREPVQEKDAAAQEN